MKKIVYPPKFYLFDLILSLFGLTFSVVALLVIDWSEHWPIRLLYIAFAVIGLFLLFTTIWNIQWVILDENALYAYNVFGLIKKIDMSKIQSAKVINARAWGIKMARRYYPCIAISSRKKINNCDIEDAFNHKKSYYIIFPSTTLNIEQLQESYMKSVGKRLEITNHGVKNENES